MPQCQFPVFCYFCVSEKLHKKYSQNWMKQKPEVQIFTEASREPKRRQKGVRGRPHHQGAWPGPGPCWPVVWAPWSTSDAAPSPIGAVWIDARLAQPKFWSLTTSDSSVWISARESLPYQFFGRPIQFRRLGDGEVRAAKSFANFLAYQFWRGWLGRDPNRPIKTPRRIKPKDPITFPETHRDLPPSSTRDREGPEALPGTLPERGIATEVFFITMLASGAMSEQSTLDYGSIAVARWLSSPPCASCLDLMSCLT
jgi:hypothetical protein